MTCKYTYICIVTYLCYIYLYKLPSIALHPSFSILASVELANSLRFNASFSSFQSLSHLWLFATPCHSMPGFPVHHQLPESTQTHVHQVSDAKQPSYPLSSPSPPALNLSQHQGLFKGVSSLHQVAKELGVSASTSVLPMNTQD